jgi:hypothetical protein
LVKEQIFFLLELDSASLETFVKGIVSRLTIKFGCAKNVAKLKITTKKRPQVL